MCAQRRLRSAWASTQSDLSLRSELSSCGQRKLWSDWVDAKAIRLGRCSSWSESSLRARSFFWFCHEAAHLWKFSEQGLVLFIKLFFGNAKYTCVSRYIPELNTLSNWVLQSITTVQLCLEGSHIKQTKNGLDNLSDWIITESICQWS